jgi:hypothetical protein
MKTEAPVVCIKFLAREQLSAFEEKALLDEFVTYDEYKDT